MQGKDVHFEFLFVCVLEVFVVFLQVGDYGGGHLSGKGCSPGLDAGHVHPWTVLICEQWVQADQRLYGPWRCTLRRELRRMHEELSGDN